MYIDGCNMVSISLGYECEDHDNPADFFLDVTNTCEKQLLDTSGQL